MRVRDRLARGLPFGALALTPVLALATAAAEQTWTLPVSLATGALLWGILVVPLLGMWLVLGRIPRIGSRSRATTLWFGLVTLNWPLVRLLVEARSHGDAGPTTWALVVGAAAVFAGWAGLRVDPHATFASALVTALLVVAAYPFATGIGRLTESAPAAPSPTVALADGTPSVWVIVLDGHPSPRILREVHGADLDEEFTALASRGFRLWDDGARANFSHTTASVASLLAGSTFTTDLGASMPVLVAGLQGDTGLTRAFRAAGHTIRMVAAPWSRSTCGALVDECLSTGGDERRFFLLRTTPLPDLFPATFGHPMPLLGRDVLLLGRDLGPAARHFTFIHSTVTHVPWLLDAQCAFAPDPTGGIASQTRCAHRLLGELLDTIDLERDIVVVASDHGYSAAVEGATSPTEWTEADRSARFGMFLAISDPTGCEDRLPHEVSAAEVLPRLLRCHGTRIDLPDVRFVGMEQGAWGRIETVEFTTEEIP